MIKFVVLSTQRSGSAFFVTSLSSHPRIHCYREIFLSTNPKPETYRTYRTSSLSRRIAHWFQRKQLINRYLADLYATGDGNTDALGFKLMYSQANQLPEVVTWIREHNVKVIHLIRLNTLKAVISHQIAKASKIHHSTRPIAQQVKVSLPPQKVKASLMYRTQQIDQYRQMFSDNPYLEVTYEAFVSDPDEETRHILQFLDIEQFAPLTSPLVKINSDSLTELIDNYDEVARTLKGTAFENLLFTSILANLLPLSSVHLSLF
jgi:LPS sulfotransferase NodH